MNTCFVERRLSKDGKPSLTDQQNTVNPPLVRHAPSRPSVPRGSPLLLVLALLVLRLINSSSASHVYNPLRSASLSSPTSTCAVARASPIARCRPSISTP